MYRIFYAAFLALMLSGYTASAFSSQCPTSNVVKDPVIFQWEHHPVTSNNPEEYYSGTLEMGKATFNIAGETVTTRAYRQEGGAYSIPGPTFVMTPGTKYVLRFKNTLPYQKLNPEHNIFKDPNVTNLHTHGLHISGESPSDDVTRFFEGGFGGDYVYNIPADHMGGTFWYHAHHHGATYLQVSSGAFGLMIIDDGKDNIPATVASMEEKHIVLGYLEPINAAGTGGDTLISGTLEPGWTVNGTVNGTVCVPPNTWQHWRILVVDQDSRQKKLEIGPQCEMAMMARDGVWRTVAPKILSDNKQVLSGASRVDIAIRCQQDSTIILDGRVIGQISVDGTPDTSPSPYKADGSTWSAKRPVYLRDLRKEPVMDYDKITIGARSLLGDAFDADVPNLTKVANGVQEWRLNGTRNHPFHMHVYHVQVQEECGAYEGGEYYDVVAESCDIRFDLSTINNTAYEGRTIMHCHLLKHEDQGAMGWMDVIGGAAPPTFPVNNDIGIIYDKYYALDGGGNNPPPPSEDSLKPGSIDVSTSSIGGGRRVGIAEITVVDNQGNPVSGATVSGEFTGDINELISTSSPTDKKGITVIATTKTVKKPKNLTFCVTKISHSSYKDYVPQSGSDCSSL